MLRDDEVEEVLDALEAHYGERLTEWERRFVNSVRDQFDEHGRLTDKQRTKLDEVFERVSGGGRDGGRTA